MWPFSKKKTSRDIAVKRMQSFVRSSETPPKTTSTALKFEDVQDTEINSIVGYIKDYAYRNLSVDKNNVKVHISKEGNSVTIVASIVYKWGFLNVIKKNY